MANASCIGIGTQTPGASLDITSGAALSANLNSSQNTYLRFQKSGTSFGDIGNAESLTSGGNACDFAIHARSTGNIILATNFTEKARIDSSGNLTVGSISAGNAGSINVSVGCAGTTAGGLQLWAATNQTHYVQFGDGTAGGAPYAGYVAYAHATDSLSLGTGTATRVTISSTGITCFSSNVCAPNFIASSTCSTAGLRVYGASGTHQWDVYLNGNNIRFSDNSSGGCFVVDTTGTFGGNVGIGVGAPLTKLHLYDSSPNYILLTNTGADGVSNAIQGGIIGQSRGYSNNLAQMANILFRNKNTAAWYKGEIAFSTNDSDGTNPAVSPVERLRIFSDGVSCFSNTVCTPFLHTYQNSNSEVQFLAMNNANCTGTSSVARMDIGNWIAQYALTIGRNGICTTGTRFGDSQANTTFIFDNAVSSCGMYIGNASSGGNLHLITGAEKRLTITSTGIACFQNTVCSPRFIGSSILTFTGLITGTQSVACQSIESLWSLASSRCCANKGGQYGNGTWYVQGGTTSGNWIYYKFMIHNPVWFRAYVYLVNYADVAPRKGCLQYSLDNSATWVNLANATDWLYSGTLDGSIALSGDSKLITLRWDSGGTSNLVGWNNVEFTACGSAFYSINGLG
jgi:hypothetical protein